MKRVKQGFLFILMLCGFTIALPSCGDDEDVSNPKPRAYYRIDFPEKVYKKHDTLCPYSFEIPLYSYVEKDPTKTAEPCWVNVVYPAFRAKLHLSYKKVNGDINRFIEDSRDLAVKHQIKATGMEQQVIIRDSAKVYGLLYDIAGNTASSLQFYLTDSTQHFLRGSLYFNAAPNIDSTKIIIDFLREDIIRLIQTCSWKETTLPITK